MRVLAGCMPAIAAFLVAGCTHIVEIRTNHSSAPHEPVDVTDPDFACGIGHAQQDEFVNSIEEYGNYFLGYVEFDDQGWSYNQNAQMQVLEARLEQELADPQYRDTEFLLVVFIHGWHHNAHDNDCNVNEFRSMLNLISYDYDLLSPPGAPENRRRVVGIYIGWRGEALDADGLRYLTIMDRRYTAEHVSKGSVRELFAMLRKHEVGANADSKHAPRMRTVVIGHSFGGLIAFHSLSQAMLNELTLNKPTANGRCSPATSPGPAAGNLQAWPDMMVLINPAFEASRFEALHHLMAPVPGCPYPNQRPKLVVVTADNDSATGFFFPIFRRVGTVFEGYDESIPRSESRERDANWHAIGFVDRYRTHRLCLNPNGRDDIPVVVASTPTKSRDWDQDEFAPIWVVGAPPAIVDGHDGFLYARKTKEKEEPKPYLLEWLIDLHMLGPERVMAKPGACGDWRSH